MKHIVLALACLSALPTYAAPPQRCMARVVKDVASPSNTTYILRRGTMWGPITQMNVEKATGQTTYCAHGSSCYVSEAFEIVTPCIFYFQPPPYDLPGNTEWGLATR